MIGRQGQLEKLNFPCATMHGGIYSAHSMDGGMDGWMSVDVLRSHTRQRFSNRLDHHRVVLAFFFPAVHVQLPGGSSTCMKSGASLRVVAAQTEITLSGSAHHQTKAYRSHPCYGNVQCPRSALPRGIVGDCSSPVDVS